jgi:uncharacterized protein YggE
MDHELLVRGEAEVRAMPDRATVRITVDGEGSSQKDAYQAAAQLAAAVDGVLAANDDAIERISTAALVVQPRTEWRNGKAVRLGWGALRTSLIEIRTLDRVGEILAVVAGAGGAIQRLSWELDPAHEAYDQARRLAGEDARRRAEQYASALGVKLGPISWIAEPGLRGVGGGGPLQGSFVAASRSAAGSRDEPMAVDPDEITVAAMIEVGYCILAD